MAKYIVTAGPIEHGAPGQKELQRYEFGDEIELSDEHAAPLLASDEIALVLKAARKGKQTEGDEGSQE